MKRFNTTFVKLILCLGIFVLFVGIVRHTSTQDLKSDSIVDSRGDKMDFVVDLAKTGRYESDEVSIITVPDYALPRTAKAKNVVLEQVMAPGTDQGVEPDNSDNNTIAAADPLTGTTGRIRGNLVPNGDNDFYSFSGTAGDRVYLGTMTSWSAGSSTDSQLRLFRADGTTIVEFDDDNGSFAGLSSSIAGAILPATETYYIEVRDFTAGTTTERPYELYFALQPNGTAPVAETEANDTPATANALPASGWVSGARNPAAATEQDWYSMTLNAGDTVYLSLDVDPEDDLVVWNGRLGIALLGDANNQILVVDDAGTGDIAPNPNRPSEALYMTVKNAGTYYAFVDSASAAVGGPTATYHLNVTIIPRVDGGSPCTTYTSTNVPQTIGPGTGLVSSTLTVPGTPRIGRARLNLQLTHALMADVDVHLRSPNSNNNGVFTDIGSAATGGQTMMDIVFDDFAGIPPAFTVLRPKNLKPELSYRLDWLNGENAGGTWTLDIYDDGANASGGTLTGWSLEICEALPDLGTLIYSESFDGTDGGFTHSGAGDEWERGLPATAATTTANPVADFLNCNSGTNCWKTDLDNTYNISSSQDLVSPTLNLTTQAGTINLHWAMRYQMESATFDHAWVQVTNVNNPADTRRVWQWYGATMTNAPGNPAVNIGASAGWGNYIANISDFAGKAITVTFHLDSDTTINFGGMAIDDVQIRRTGVTAANVSLGGRVLTANGSGISRATVTISGGTIEPRSVQTSSFGYYSFPDLPAGQTYVITVGSKSYTFAVPNRVITLTDSVDNADFVADPQE